MATAWTYLLRLRDGRLYAGWCVDPLARLAAHRAGRGSKAVRAALPAELVWLEAQADRGAAMRREVALKRLGVAAKRALVAADAARTAALLATLREHLRPQKPRFSAILRPLGAKGRASPS